MFVCFVAVVVVFFLQYLVFFDINSALSVISCSVRLLVIIIVGPALVGLP